jgi:hypothetical protein
MIREFRALIKQIVREFSIIREFKNHLLEGKSIYVPLGI